MDDTTTKPISVGDCIALAHRAKSDPAWFAETTFGHTLHPFHKQILASLKKHQITAVRSADGMGAETAAAMAILWWCCTEADRYAVGAHGCMRASRAMFWSELCRLMQLADGRGRSTGAQFSGDVFIWDRLGSIAVPRVAEGADSMFDGMRSTNGTLIVIDGANRTTGTALSAALRMLTNPNNRVLVMCTPTFAEGPVRDLFDRDDVSVIAASAFDSPNLAGLTVENIASGAWASKAPPQVSLGFPTAEWVRSRWEQFTDHGRYPRDPRWVSRVLGEFPKPGESETVHVAKDRETGVVEAVAQVRPDLAEALAKRTDWTPTERALLDVLALVLPVALGRTNEPKA